MAKPKKGQLAQFMVPMVDSTDFNSVESAITASDFNSGATVKFYGLNQGGSAATTSGTVSKTASLVRSGVFRITLKTTENNYDMMQLRVNKTGCAEQILQWENVDNDDSDLMSALTVIQSMASDAASAAQQGNSRALINQSRVSDIQSFLSDFQSDLLSHVDTTGVGLNASTMSDLRSAINGITASVSASDMSDIASRVDVLLTSRLSDILSAAQQTNSRVLVNQSRISDVQSYLVAMSDALSDAHSDLASKIGNVSVTLTASDISDIASAVAGAVTGVTASDISDIASAVRAILVSDLSDILSAAQQTNSRTLVVQSRVSDVQSFLSDFQSDLLSHLDTTGVGLNASTLSDLRSAIAAQDSNLSDILSAANQINSRVLLNQSRISDVASYLAALSGAISDIESQVDAGIELGASSLSDIRSAITANGLLAAGAEPGSVPGLTDTHAAHLNWLTAMSRNKLTQTSSLQSLRNDADNDTIASAATSYDTGTSTFTRGEFA